MPKPNRNGCKIGKQTNLLVQGNRTAVQKSQVTVDTKTQQTKKVCIIHLSKLSANNKVCIIHLSDISYLCLAKYVNLKQNNQNI